MITWVKSVHITDYSLSAYYCRRDRIHGGVAIFCKSSLKQTCLDLGSFCVELNFECCACMITIDKTTYGIVLIYRSPVGCIDTFLEGLNDVLNIVESKCNKIILCGDLNIDIRKKSIKADMLRDIFESHDLKGDWNQPTRIVHNTDGTRTESLIDYMVTNITKDCYESTLCDFNMADHLA